MARTFTDERLGNGLRLLVDEDHVAPVVAVSVAYGAGSRCEGDGEGELAHLFEHMMFEGSAHVAPGEHVALLAATGGSANGRTQPDCTTFSSVVPAHCAELVLWLEAERLANLPAGLTPESLDRQRAVVRNEHRQRRVGVPYGSALSDLGERLFPPGHPYHTSMARRTDLDRATLPAVEAFFRRHYVPANAVVAVCGDVEAGEVRRWAEAYFGAIPGGDVPAPVEAPLEPLPGEVRDAVDAAVPMPRTYVAWRAPVEGTPEYDAFAVASAALAVGAGSRLRRLVRDSPVVADAVLAVQGRAAGPSFAYGYVTPRPGATLADAEAVFDEAVRGLTETLTEGEVARAARLLTTAHLHQVSPLGGRAYTLSTGALLQDDPRAALDRAAAYAAVTPERARTVAATVLRPDERVVRTFLPKAAS